MIESWERLLDRGIKTVYPAHGKPFPAEVMRAAVSGSRAQLENRKRNSYHGCNLGRPTVSSYVYMRVLESAPERYDRGIALLSRGSIERVYESIARQVASPGRKILDIGCGTGGVSLACARLGAEVTGIDINAGMLRVARDKASACELPGRVDFVQLGAMEIEDRFAEGYFDAVVSCLAFSELSPEERAHTLKTVKTRLRKGGALVIADEQMPEAFWARWRRMLRRLPMAVLTYLLTQTSTRPLRRLAEAVREAGFGSVREEKLQRSVLVVVSAKKEGK